MGWKYNIITSGAACQSVLFVMRKFMQMHFYYLTYFFYLQGAEFELDNIKKLSKEYAEAKELAFAGARISNFTH